MIANGWYWLGGGAVHAPANDGSGRTLCMLTVYHWPDRPVAPLGDLPHHPMCGLCLSAIDRYLVEQARAAATPSQPDVPL